MRLGIRKTSLWLLVICLIFKCGNPVLADDDSEEDDAVVEDEPIEDSSIVEDINYETPKPNGPVHLYESFDELARYKKRWVLSTARKDDAEVEISKYDGKWTLEQSKQNSLKGDWGLVLKSKAKHHAIAVLLDKPFKFEKKPLVVQYEVNFQEGQECGGAYLKLLSAAPDFTLANFNDKTPYTIMFGPDKCGSDHKVHFIFRHKNPINGTYTEKHSKQPDNKPLEEHFKDKKSHLYTLVVNPDNTYNVLIDQISVVKGSLLEDFTPPVNPPKEIDDPYDRKPEDWDEREKIPDPNSRKPDDWDEDAPRQIPDPNSVKPEDWLDDEPEMIPDPNAEKPSDWEDEMDGEWEAPLVANPKCEKAGCGLWKPAMLDNPNYKGKWRAPLVANPNYKGKWKPRKMPNADYFEDDHPFKMTSIVAVGLELWSMSPDILFDNIMMTNDKSVADYIASQTWELKRRKADRDAETIFKRIIKYTNKHPWLWAVYVVVIGLPIVLIFVFCCTSSDDKKKAALAKKTDAPTPDDEPLPEPAPIVSKEPLSATKSEVKPAVIEELPDKEESQDESEEKDDEMEKDEKETSEEAEAEEVETSGSHDGSGDIGRSPRRRRPRRD